MDPKPTEASSPALAKARRREKDPSDDLPGLKRPKVTMACDHCRTRKIKCDGIQPVCGPCKKRKGPDARCSWLHGYSRNENQASRDRILELEKRIKELERENTNLVPLSIDSKLPPSSDVRHSYDQYGKGYPSFTSSLHTLTRPGVASLFHDGPVGGQEHCDVAADHSASLPESPMLQPPFASTSPINAMIGSLDGDGDRLGIFGNSSAGNFVSQVRKAVDRRLGSSASKAPYTMLDNETLLETGRQNNGEPLTEVVDYELPSRQRADMLMSVYWNTAWPVYPFTDKGELMSCYEALWTGQGLPHNGTEFLSMINTIFAMSSRASVTATAKERQNSSETFFQRAKSFLNFWKPGSLQTVQCFLLFAQYLQSTNEPHQCWMCVGNAVRTALSIGLHLPETSTRITSPARRELVRRVWHGCILMDRALAMTYGRPTMIEGSVAAVVPLPLPIESDISESAPLQEHMSSPSMLDFFNQIIKLYGITYEILVEFYAPRSRYGNPPTDKHDYFGLHISAEKRLSILDVDRNFRNWESGLPMYLKHFQQDLEAAKCGRCSQTKCVFVRQAVVLRQRFLHMRLLSLRPILTAFVAGETDECKGLASFGIDLSTRVAHQCSMVCVKIAQEAISLVHSNRSPPWETTGLVAVWWYNVLFVYSAATVLIAARLKISVVSEIGEKSILQSWEMAMDILKEYISFSDSIPRLVTALHVLFDEIPALYSQQVLLQQQQQGIISGLHHDSNNDPTESHFRNENNDQARGQEKLLPGTRTNFSELMTIPPGDYRSQLAPFQHRPTVAGPPRDDCTFMDLNLDPGDFSWLSTNPFDF